MLLPGFGQGGLLPLGGLLELALAASFGLVQRRLVLLLEFLLPGLMLALGLCERV